MDLAVSVAAADLSTVSQLFWMRPSSPTAEPARIERMRHLALLAAELIGTLRTYSRHAPVHCQGTAGTRDLEADTEALVRDLRDFLQAISTRRVRVRAPHAFRRQ